MSTLHITNGDCAADTLRRIVDSPVVIAADVLHEGPCPAVDGDAWHEVRAHFLAPYGGTTPDELKAALAEADRAIVEAYAHGDEIVLWFEHDLFDQLALIRTLDLIARLKPRATCGVTGGATSGVSLICVGSFPGIDRFVGLGQLTSSQFATLVGTGVPVTADHGAIASAAWSAFRSPDPRMLFAISESRALPFLHAALRRFLAEYPSAANGLSRTEALALHALADGESTGGALFGATQANEAAPFMGDLTFLDILRRLASCRVPLVTVNAEPDEGDLRPRRIAITDAGREVIAGRADHVRLNGIDLWRGGVHLAGSDHSPWRWDARGETLVS